MNIVSIITICKNMLTFKCIQFAITITFLLALTPRNSVVECNNEEQSLKNVITQSSPSSRKGHRKDMVRSKNQWPQFSNQADASSDLKQLKNEHNYFDSLAPASPGNLTARASRRWCRMKLMGSKRRKCIRRAQKALRQKRKHQHRHRHHHSLKCSRCSPGQFMVSRCTREQDTVCTSCAKGTYNSHNSHRRQCLRCSQCGPSLYILHACSPVADAVCDACQSATKRGPPFAEDYYLKCSSFNATVAE